ncbi:MAG: potassium transporter Kup [Candidatus Hydrogenedentales bacterium]|jgi:KUP system potassium uptake protein
MNETNITDKKQLATLTLGALGVVYGDLGTSPLYTIRECFTGLHGLDPTRENVLGVLSLIVWALAAMICVKYMLLVLRADNRGEGGILALMALAHSKPGAAHSMNRKYIVILGLFGAALLYGDGAITPAITVLGAVEGLHTATSLFDPYVVPLALVILTVMFSFQRFGTARIGALFGPIIVVWFLTIAVLGIGGIVTAPGVLAALNPWYGIHLLISSKWTGFVILGSVFLALTGGEALYADLGHFGRRAIVYGWFGLALPALLLNYFGQGALLLSEGKEIANPFYALAPRWFLAPLVLIATAAAVIASQAVISGAFSVTRQAVLLGFLPRMKIVHTSSELIGQIFVPVINRILLVLTIALVLYFRTSGNLAAAYGFAVTGTMLITTMLLYVVARERWGWSLQRSLPIFGFFLMVDLTFFSASVVKIPHGGWFPLVSAIGVFAVMSTWRSGRELLREQFQKRLLPFPAFIEDVAHGEHRPHRVSGAAIFMTGSGNGTPPVLLHNLKYNRIIHETVALMSIVIDEVSHVPRSERVTIENLGHGFYRIQARYGFMESPAVAEILSLCKDKGLAFNSMTTGFFLGRESVRIANSKSMPKWRLRLYSFLSRNAQPATSFFEIPANQVVELGLHVEL